MKKIVKISVIIALTALLFSACSLVTIKTGVSFYQTTSTYYVYGTPTITIDGNYVGSLSSGFIFTPNYGDSGTLTVEKSAGSYTVVANWGGGYSRILLLTLGTGDTKVVNLYP